MRKHLRRSRRKFFSVHAWKVRMVFWTGAFLVGATCALFAILSQNAEAWFHRQSTESIWIPLLLPPAGLLCIVWLILRFFPGAQGSGIPQAIAALEMNRKSTVLSLRIAFGKIVLTITGLASGASIGREGPSVHIGASIMYSLGKYARFPAHYMERGLILAGPIRSRPYLAALASYLSGIPGGIFAPSLATGAGVGMNLGHWLPMAPMSVMILLGMVAYFSGVVQSPITAFVIVMEMTNNQDMLLALMATSFIAYGSSHLICPQPLYRSLAQAFISPAKTTRGITP